MEAILEKLPTALFIHRGGIITYCNQKAERLLERSDKELRGARLLQLVHPDDRKPLIEYHRSGFHSGPCDIRIEVPGGNWKWIRFLASPFGEKKAVICVGLELGQRPVVEKQAIRGERLLERLFNSIPQGISVLDKDLNIVRVNPAMERWYAHSMPLVGKKCFQAYHGRSNPCPECPTIRTLETGKREKAIIPLRNGDFQQIGWLSLQSAPLKDVDTGEVTGVIEYVEDITDIQRTQEALKRSQELLSKALNASSDWISMTKIPEGYYVEVNEAFERKTGYRKEEVIGKTSLELGIWAEP